MFISLRKPLYRSLGFVHEWERKRYSVWSSLWGCFVAGWPPFYEIEDHLHDILFLDFEGKRGDEEWD